MASSAAINSENSVKRIYLTVIDEVLTNVREAFLDEGLDEQLLQELRQLWENKLNASRAVQNSDETSTNGNAASSANSTNSNSLRLPTTMSNKDTTRNSNANSVNNQNNSDIKTEVDPATRQAINTFQTTLQHNHNLINHHHLDSRATTNGNRKSMPQVDGGVDGSSSDEDDDDDDLDAGSMHDEEDDDKTNNEDHSECEGKEDPEPLNSDDDLTDQGSPDSQSDLFDTDHVIVCQYDKITRIKNRWKFHLKDGIMNINGRDYLFSKANGDAEW